MFSYEFPFSSISTFNNKNESFSTDAPEPEILMLDSKSATFQDFAIDTISTRIIL